MIDIYTPDEARGKGVSVNIIKEYKDTFRVNIRYKNLYYILEIIPSSTYDNSFVVYFGSTNFAFKGLNMDILLHKSTSPLILATLFGLLRYWVNKYDIKRFEYKAEGHIRQVLYSYYLYKHFKDFEDFEDENEIMIWTKK